MEMSPITLRPPRLSDVTRITKFCKEPALGRYMPNLPYPYVLKDAVLFVRRSMKAEKNNIWFTRAIVRVESDELVGMISFHNVDFKNKKAELGYWIGKPFWGQGLATKATDQMLQFGFSELKLERVYARVFDPNKASSRVLIKCGFEHEGMLRRSEFHRRRWLDEHYYGILKSEWREMVR